MPEAPLKSISRSYRNPAGDPIALAWCVMALLAAVGVFSIMLLMAGAETTYELDNGHLVTFWGDRGECETARAAIEADDGTTVTTVAPWGERHTVRKVWCNHG